MDGFKSWLSSQVSLFLGFECPDIAEYVALEVDEHGVEDYLGNILGSKEGVAAVLAECKSRLRVLKGGGSLAPSDFKPPQATNSVNMGGRQQDSRGLRVDQSLAAGDRAVANTGNHSGTGPGRPKTSAPSEMKAQPATSRPAAKGQAAVSAGTNAAASSAATGKQRPATQQRRATNSPAAPASTLAAPALKAAATELRPGSVGGGNSAAAGSTSEPVEPARPCARCCRLPAATGAEEHCLLGNCVQCGRIHCRAEADVVCIECGAPLQHHSGVPVTHDLARRERLAAAEADARRERISSAGLPFAPPSVGGARKANAAGAAGSSSSVGASTGAAETAASAADRPAPSGDGSLDAALAHRDKLLHFQATSAARTRVLDDQADYFTDSTSSWLSPEERAAAAKAAAAREAERNSRSKGMRVALDFAGRSVVVRDELSEKEAATRDALKALAFGAAPGAQLSPSSASFTPGVGAPAASGAGDAVEDGPLPLFPTGPGARAFANPTLAGRAAEVYAHILAEAHLERRPRAAGGGGGDGSRRGGPAVGIASASSRVQHSYDPLGGDAAAVAPPSVGDGLQGGIDDTAEDGGPCG